MFQDHFGADIVSVTVKYISCICTMLI